MEYTQDYQTFKINNSSSQFLKDKNHLELILAKLLLNIPIQEYSLGLVNLFLFELVSM